MRRFLKREMYVYALDLDKGDQVKVERDPDVLAALDLLPKAQQLTEEAPQRAGRR